MKNEMHLVFIHTIGSFLTDVDTRYLVKPFSETEFFIQREPAIYCGHLKDIYDLMCYDYDDLPNNERKMFKQYVQSFERIDGNLYKQKEPIIEKKK